MKCLLYCWGIALCLVTSATTGPLPDMASSPQCVGLTDGSGSTALAWPGRLVPFTMDTNMPADLRLIVLDAMQYWENYSCNQFVPRTSQMHYAHFILGQSCCISYEKNNLSIYLNSTCNKTVTVMQILGKLIGASDLDIERSSTKGSIAPAVCPNRCGRNIWLNSGSQSLPTIQSPNYPSDYPTNIDCMWKVTAPPLYTLLASFSSFDVENGPYCSYDHVEVMSVDSLGNILRVSWFCGTTLPQLMMNPRTKLIIVSLHSDVSYSKKGFQLRFNISAVTSTVSCLVQNGGCSQLCIADNAGWKQSCACNAGYVLGTDGLSCIDDDECLKRSDGCTQNCRNTVGSYYCYCNEGYGLDLDQKTCRVCGTTYNNSLGFLFSPGYPDSYPAYQNCKWYINTAPNNYLRVTVQVLDIASSDRCQTDYLQLDRGNFRYNGKLCGYHSLSYVINTGLTVAFHSEAAVASRSSGFLLLYKQLRPDEVSLNDINYVVVDGVKIAASSKTKWL
eukprot:Em0008g943a